MTQISANISPATRDRLERYVRSRGLKKGFVIEQALLHHLLAVAELPDEVVIPPRLVVTPDAGARILDRLAADEGPNAALRALFDGELNGDDP
jgi:hypothetical protein